MEDMRPDGGKRRLVRFLLGLHVAALMAAAFLIARAGLSPSEQNGGTPILAFAPKDTVAWVTIRGPIYMSETGRPWEHGAEQTARRIEQLAATPGVRAMVLDINSPGGSVGAVQEIYSRVQRVRREKHIPVVALFDDVAASGGYYIASACDKIVAHPGSLTGSIGVIFEVSNLEGLFQKIGLRMEPIKSGKHKDIGSPSRTMTPEERRILQALIDDAYGQFVKAVSDGRRIPIEKVKPLADGRIYSGAQALSLHLVDRLGDSRAALLLAARLGGITEPEPAVRRDTERWGSLVEMLDSKSRLAFGLGPISLPVPAALSETPRGLLYLWPGG